MLFGRGASALHFEFVQNPNIKGIYMQNKISMNLSFCQLENEFSLDELVIKLADKNVLEEMTGKGCKVF